MARETFYIYRDLKRDREIAGFVVQERFFKPCQSLFGKKVIPESFLRNIRNKNTVLIGAIGSPLRQEWINKLEKEGYIFDTVIHKSSLPWGNVIIEYGSIISKGAVISCDINIGKHCIVNLNSNLNHDCLLGDFVTVGPGSHIGGNVKIGKGTWIGIGTTIIHHISVGKHCFIAAGAVVVKDIADYSVAMGVPAKVIRRVTQKDWQEVV